MGRALYKIKDFAKLTKDLHRADWDNVVMIVGDTGVGKSVFMIHFGKALDPTFNVVRNLPYVRSELNEMIEKLPDESYIGVDEAVGLFYSRDFHDTEQNALLKKLDRSRDRRMTVALLIPDFFMLDKAIRHGRGRFLIWIDQRIGHGKDGVAHAYIFEKENNLFNPDRWNLKLNARLMRSGQIHKSPNYIGEIEYGQLDEKEYRLYKEVKALKREIAEILEWERAKRRTDGARTKKRLKLYQEEAKP